MVRKTKLFCLCGLIYLSLLNSVQAESKSSLTFVIDDTGSMFDDINAVKRSVNDIFNAVMNSNASQIEDFVLVTFNDPTIQHRITTRNRDDFKAALAKIKVDGGDDCPEMAMSGIELALQKSRPGSILYAYTDASAKDFKKQRAVKNLAHSKNIQVTFVLTGKCGDGKEEVYYEVAEATGGQVFNLNTRRDVEKLLKYVQEQIKSRKSPIARKEFSSGTHSFEFAVDSKMKELVVSLSGEDPVVKIIDPDKRVAPTEEITKTSTFAVVKVTKVKPGIYTAEVTSSTKNSVVINADTSVHFEHGFSTFMPTSIGETVNRPIPGEKSYLSIKLSTDEPGDVILDEVQIMDLDNNVLAGRPLHLVDKKEQFYITNTTLVPPDSLFKVAIRGHDTKSMNVIIRISLTPIEPQSKVPTASRIPTVTLTSESKINAEYDKPLTLSCKVSGHPRPEVIWKSSDGTLLDSTLSLVELPYDYMTTVSLDRVIRNATYICTARNYLGGDSKQIQVETIRKTYFNVIKKPKTESVEYKKEARFECVVDAFPPAEINWYKNGRVLVEDDNVNISSNRSVLLIKHMQPSNKGDYVCTARNEDEGRKFLFSVFIAGVEVPVIDKTIREIRAKEEGSYVEIPCPVIRGMPKPTILWLHKDQYGIVHSMADKANEEKIIIPKTTRESVGTYLCEARNDLATDHHRIDLILNDPPKIYGKENEEIIAKKDEIVHMNCDVSGEPKPTVKWYINGTELVMTSRFARGYPNPDGFSFSSTENDTGIYTCVASNEIGSANKTIHLHIVRPPTVDPPEESSISLNVGEFLQLPCYVEGYPEPDVKWMFLSMDPESKPKYFSPNTASHGLRLGRVQVKDRGFYSCIASNIGGSENITYQLEIFAPPQIQNIYPEKTFKGVMGDLVLRIPCKATGNPTPEITWMQDSFGKIAAGTEWYDIEKDGTLVIKNLDKLSAGSYVCEARNRLNIDTESYEVIVEAYPRLGAPAKTIRLERGNSTTLECSIPHKLTDYVRWFKDGRQISETKKLHIPSARPSDSGIYTCRVSDFEKSRSGHIELIVGFAPTFMYEEEENIEFEEGLTAIMDCSAAGNPEPQVTWWHEGRQIPFTNMTYLFDMKFSNRGKYFCLVSNEFGYIQRAFNIVARDCFLNVETDLKGNQPLILSLSSMTWPEFDTIDGNLRIPSSEYVLLSCPSGFKNIYNTEVIASCEREEFTVDSRIYRFSELQCKGQTMPVIRRTGTSCSTTNPYSETIKIGYEVRRHFTEVFEVCLDMKTKVPLYAKNGIHYSLANVEPREKKWNRNALVPYDIDELYNCELQTQTISSVLRRWFHVDDKCCFSKRPLVNSRDVSPGVSQMATFTALNLVPQWSTCDSQNWESIERRVRGLARSTHERLLVWTGTAQQLQISGHNISIYDKKSVEQPIPKYLWKVVQDPSTRASLAIIQLNIPDLTPSEAIRHVFCRDICHEVSWMQNRSWRDVTKGYTFCCSIFEFERALGYDDFFNSGTGKVLHDVSFSADHSLV